MGNLRDQLKQANLLSKKDAKRLAHEERLHHKEAGGAKGAEQERAAHVADLKQKQEAQRKADREREAARAADQAAAAERAACEELLRREVRTPSRRGARRWHFCLADGRVPSLMLSMQDRVAVTDGVVCVVRRGAGSGHDYGLLVREHAVRVAAVFPDRIAWQAGG